MSSPAEVWTIRRVLEWTAAFFTRKAVDSPRLSAELLLSHVLAVPRIKLYTDYQRPLSDDELSTFRALVQRTVEQEPIAYLTGKAHFFNLELEVTRDVLIPRPDTETLVENVVQLCRHQPGLESPRILDLCTGSGCIAAALAKSIKGAMILATDISESAVAVARRNIEKLGLSDRVVLAQGDLFDPLTRMVDPSPFDLIVANPPYIPSAEVETLDRSVKDYEPRTALDGGQDGLAFHRRILEGAAERLVPGGRLYLELAFNQGPAAQELASHFTGYDETKIVKDYANHDRVLTLRRRA